MRRPARRGRGAGVSDTPAVLVLLGIAGLIVAWSFAVTPFSAPDETAHYVRAIGVGSGDLVGEPIPWPTGNLTPTMHRWVEQATRSVVVPEGLSPTANCGAADLTRPPVCIHERGSNEDPVEVGTSTGTYDPAPYALPGVAMRWQDDSLVALWVGRLAMAAQALALLAPAAWLLWRRAGVGALAGMVVAATPMAIYTWSTLNPSSIEVAAGVGIAAAAVALLVDARWGWALAGVSAFAIAASRSSGLVWAIALLGSAALWVGPRLWLRRARERPWECAAAAVLAVAGLALNRWWAVAYGPEVEMGRVTLPGLRAWFDVFGATVFRQAVGWFGAFSLRLPEPVYVAWAIALVVLLALAVVRAGAYRRAVLLVVAAGVVLSAPVVYYVIVEGTGFGPQARHVLPGVVFVPVIAGAALHRPGDASPRAGRGHDVLAWLAVAAAIVAATLVLAAWFAVAHRAAVGAGGTWWFLTRSAWAPPGGWWWNAILAGLGWAAVVGGLLFAAFTHGPSVGVTQRPDPGRDVDGRTLHGTG